MSHDLLSILPFNTAGTSSDELLCARTIDLTEGLTFPPRLWPLVKTRPWTLAANSEEGVRGLSTCCDIILSVGVLSVLCLLVAAPDGVDTLAHGL